MNQTWESSNSALRAVALQHRAERGVCAGLAGIAAHVCRRGRVHRRERRAGRFSGLAAQNVPSAAYSASGFSPALDGVYWYINGGNSVFYSDGNDRSVHGNPAGVSTAFAD